MVIDLDEKKHLIFTADLVVLIFALNIHHAGGMVDGTSIVIEFYLEYIKSYNVDLIERLKGLSTTFLRF